jgi:hypothetical protein
MLPIFLGVIAAIAGTSGVALGITGAVDMANANSKINSAKRRDEENRNRFNCIEINSQISLKRFIISPNLRRS